MNATALVGLGANTGDREANLRDAVRRLGALPSTRVIQSSAIVVSTAVGAPGPDYLNAVTVLDTALTAPDLLAAVLGIEAAMGRVRRERWGPRPIDLDLLAWIPEGETTSIHAEGELELPHPRMTARDFVLVPLVEVWPALTIDGVPVTEHLARLPNEHRSIIGRVDADL